MKIGIVGFGFGADNDNAMIAEHAHTAPEANTPATAMPARLA